MKMRYMMWVSLTLAAVLSPWAVSGEEASGEIVAVSSPGLIDVRAAAVAGEAVIVVETRYREMKASSEDIIDTAREIGTLLFIR